MKARTLEKFDLRTTPTVGFNASGDALLIIDQTRLPGEVVLLELDRLEDIRQAISSLQVRGAPAIGVAAVIGLAVVAARLETADATQFRAECERLRCELAAARPTAVNLAWALDRLAAVLAAAGDVAVSELKAALLAEAEAIRAADVATCRAIGEHGYEVVKGCRTVLTHCNAGQLATVRYGTALAPIYVAQERGHELRVFADETRPLLQGARLTAFELTAAGIDTTVLCDNMAASLLAAGQIDAVLVGADRIAASGDAANKIGTLGVAVLAHEFGVPFYVCAPSSTIDPATPTGREIVIEERDGAEVRSLWYSEPMVPHAAQVYNPAFDVTPARYISGIITERGIVRPERVCEVLA